MKIFMIANFSPNDPALGMTKKINAQIETLRSMGNEIFYTAYMDFGVGIYDNNNLLIEQKLFPLRNKRVFRFARMFFLVNTARKFAAGKSFDLAFVRWTGLGNDVIRMLKVLRKHCRFTVMDTHGYFKGQKGNGLIGRYISETTEHNQKKVHGLIDLVLSETNENELFGAEVQRYDNGVDVSGTRMHEYIGDKNCMNMISIANERSYHGYDRVIRSMADYKKNGLPIRLHLVGVLQPQTVDLIKKLGVENDVILYGKQHGVALDNIYDKCNMGVGPVGQHRIGGKMGTGLKTKEYFAKGIPYFYGGNELIVPKNYPYVLEVPSDESLIDLKKVYDFCLELQDKPIAQDMRAFASEHFSWNKIYSTMFDKLNSRI